MAWPGAGAALLFLGACSLKATVLLAVAWFAAVAARGRSASLSHRIWTVAVLASLALPLLTIALSQCLPREMF